MIILQIIEIFLTLRVFCQSYIFRQPGQTGLMEENTFLTLRVQMVMIFLK